MLENYPDVLTVYDVAEILRIHYSTVYDMLRDGQLPYIRVRTAYRISKKSILKLLPEENPQSNN